ncbi:MAG: hypothetical protein K9K84_10585 [Methylovulum sp.]|nr:hypothetical protein [Methylovulum sp.]
MAVLTLNQAAKAAKKSKSTIQYALKTGRLSGHKDEKGNYQIDTSELFRVYDSNTVNIADRTTLERVDTDVKTALLVQKLEFLEQRLDRLENEKNEISRRLDKSEEERRETQAKLTALLTFQQEEPTKVQEQDVKKENKLWKKLFK